MLQSVVCVLTQVINIFSSCPSARVLSLLSVSSHRLHPHMHSHALTLFYDPICCYNPSMRKYHQGQSISLITLLQHTMFTWPAFLPDPTACQPLTVAAILPLHACYYLLAVLAILPHTYILRLAWTCTTTLLGFRSSSGLNRFTRVRSPPEPGT
jgi:hypothetical protein